MNSLSNFHTASEDSEKLKELLDPENRKGILAQLFENRERSREQELSSNNSVGESPCDLLIVGGGLAGILMALRISGPHVKRSRKVVLCERESQLGGRLFFSSPFALSGTAPERLEAHLAACEQGGRLLSGFGFEAFDTHALEVLERHLVSHLTEAERDFVEVFVKHGNGKHGHGMHGSAGAQDGASELVRKCYLVKKEFTSLERILHGSTEIYTKKEAEALEKLFHENLVGDASNDQESETEGLDELGVGGATEPVSVQAASAKAPHGNTFEHSEFWTGLSKAQKEALSPLLETLLGDRFGKCSEKAVRQQAHSFYESLKKPQAAFFSRISGLEFALQAILLSRGVDVRTSCQVARLTYLPEQKMFETLLGDEVDRARKQLLAKRVCLAMPVAKCLAFLSRDALSPSQARLLTKNRPRSLVAAEYFGIEHALSPEWPDNCAPGSQFIFPVERVQALLTSQRSLVFYSTLDFEDSLQAPSVREKIKALRKAASRVLNEKVVRQFSPGMRGKEVGTSERIVLLSVATSTPWHAGNHEYREVKMSLPGLYSCGDHFTFATEPWKNIVDSVHEVFTLLNKEGGLA